MSVSGCTQLQPLRRRKTVAVIGAQLPFHLRCYKLPPMCRCPMSDIIIGLTLLNGVQRRSTLDRCPVRFCKKICDLESQNYQQWCVLISELIQLKWDFRVLIRCYFGTIFIKRRRRRIYSSSFATITITTKRYIDRLPGRVYAHQCWPPMTNHM